MGEGWSGSLGTGSFDSIQLSNIDKPNNNGEEEVYDNSIIPNNDDPHYTSSNGLIEISTVSNMVVKDVACGWAHTLLLLQDNDSKKVVGYMTGRPFDFRSTLRLKRLPTFLRDFVISYVIPQFQSMEYIDSFPSFVKIPFDIDYTKVAGSAGMSAIQTPNKEIYCFGRNEYGQCGIGTEKIQTIWPSNDMKYISIPKVKIKIHDDDTSKHGCFVDVALGLQHCVSLDEEGNVYTWGKNARGQCGNVEELNKVDEQKDANRTTTATNSTIGYQTSPKIIPNLPSMDKIASGFHLSVALCKNENQVYIWGKNVLLKDKPTDADTPIVIEGLPNKRITDIACTSHSTSILFEDGSVWGYGVTTDNAKLTSSPICMLPPGIITFPIIDFYASFDRTFVVSDHGKQVLELQLWSDGYENEEQEEESLESSYLDHAAFTPVWFNDLIGRGERVKFVRRGWLHTIIVTEVDE